MASIPQLRKWTLGEVEGFLPGHPDVVGGGLEPLPGGMSRFLQLPPVVASNGRPNRVVDRALESGVPGISPRSGRVTSGRSRLPSETQFPQAVSQNTGMVLTLELSESTKQWACRRGSVSDRRRVVAVTASRSSLTGEEKVGKDPAGPCLKPHPLQLTPSVPFAPDQASRAYADNQDSPGLK